MSTTSKDDSEWCHRHYKQCVCVCAHISVLMGLSVVSLMEAICRVYQCAEDKRRTFQWVERLTDYFCSLSAKFKNCCFVGTDMCCAGYLHNTILVCGCDCS